MAFKVYKDDVAGALFTVLIIFGLFTIVVTTLRFIAAQRAKRRLSLEDWLALSSELVYLASTGFSLAGKSALVVVYHLFVTAPVLVTAPSPQILIAIRKVLLLSNFNVVLAFANGRHTIDLAYTDQDEFEFLRKVRDNIQRSHLPCSISADVAQCTHTYIIHITHVQEGRGHARVTTHYLILDASSCTPLTQEAASKSRRTI